MVVVRLLGGLWAAGLPPLSFWCWCCSLSVGGLAPSPSAPGRPPAIARYVISARGHHTSHNPRKSRSRGRGQRVEDRRQRGQAWARATLPPTSIVNRAVGRPLSASIITVITLRYVLPPIIALSIPSTLLACVALPSPADARLPRPHTLPVDHSQPSRATHQSSRSNSTDIHDHLCDPLVVRSPLCSGRCSSRALR